MSEKFTPETHEFPQTEPKLLDLSQDLYEGGKADISKIGEYVKVAIQKGITEKTERLDLTGSTMMVIYAAVSAEAGRPDSKVKEFAFNNPAREGRVVLWTPEISESAPDEPPKSLMIEAPASTIDPEAPQEVLDLRLTFADNPEAMQQMADPQKAEEYMKEIIAQIRALKNKGVSTLRITGIPIWLAQGAYFAAVREGDMERVISYTLSSEMIVYDKNNPERVGETNAKQPENITVNLGNKEIRDISLVQSGRALQETLGTDISRHKIELTNIDLKKLPPDVALRMCDSFHSIAVSLKVAGFEVFQHLDPRSHDLVPKTRERNTELLPKDQRIPIILNIHDALEANNSDPEKTALALAKEAVNKASELTFSGITNELELAIAGKVAHAAHGLIEELRYQGDGGEIVVKSWKPKQEKK